MKTPEDGFKNMLDQYLRIPDSDWKLFTDKLSSKKLKKGDIFLKEGKIARELAFVMQGTLRLCTSHYDEREGKIKERTIYFANNNRNVVISSFESLLYERPSKNIVEALEDSLILVINYDDLRELYNKSHPICRLSLLINEIYVARGINQVRDDKINSPYERFCTFKKEQSEVFDNPNIKASYKYEYINISRALWYKFRNERNGDCENDGNNDTDVPPFCPERITPYK